MTTISSDLPDSIQGAAWDIANSQKAESNELPELLAVEAEKNYRDINVRPFFATLAIEQEKLRDGKITLKNTEMKALRDKLSTITTFLDKANQALMMNPTSKDVLINDSDLLFQIKGMLPEHASKLMGDGSTFERRKLEWLCQVLTRKIDSEITPEIDELKDQIFDIMQLLDKILPILKDLVKRYDDHINYMLRQPK